MQKKRKKEQDPSRIEWDTFDAEKDKTEIFDDELSVSARVAIENLCKFIRRNKDLIHADFSYTGLSEK